MSVTAAAGILAFGPQGGMGQTPASWYRHRAVNIDLGVLDDVREGPQEVGGVAVPTFPYKSGYMVGGGAVLQPRLENTLGWLLYAMMGKVTSAENPGASGMYDHLFEMATDSTYVPWLSFRKVIPRRQAEAGTDLGEEYKDCKILGATFTLPGDSPIGMRIDALGRDFEESLDPGADYIYDNDYEHWESIPVGCQTAGFIKVDGNELPVVSAQVSWANAPLDPRQERVYGSPMLDDITVVQRRLSFDLMVKWNNPDLYLQTLTGSPSATVWTGTPFTAALDINTVSSVNMPSKSEPYSLRIQAEEVMLNHVGAIQLAGGQAVLMRFQGSALESTGFYAKMTLRNKNASYVWPVGSGS
mgnify:CR=1 FL=1